MVEKERATMTRAKLFVAAALGYLALVAGSALANDAPATPDSEIHQRVTESLAKVSPGADKQIHIATENGVVTLSGYVHSSWEQQQILSAVRGTEGVTSVKNELRVKM
jgi:osmotically-inducible protein OsmY